MGTRTIRVTFKIEGVATDVTSALLSDATGTYGVWNDTDSEVTVADATAMTHDSTGVYSYSFDADYGSVYTAWVELVYGGNTYRQQHSFAATFVTDPDDATLCVVQFRVKLSTTAVASAVCKAKLLGVNQAADGTILSNEESSDTTDSDGVAELQLVQKGSIVKGSGLYKIWVEIAGKPVASVETTIPNQSTIYFEDMLLA